MSNWHGYPQHPDAHPERPWWRPISSMRWRRTDGRISRAVCWPDALDEDEAEVVHAQDVCDELARLDTAHPLPPPEPRCGQVWVLPDVATHCTVIGVQDGAGYYVDPRGVHRMPWPPPGAVLVAGPGAPWALWEVDDDS
jgi:hypothetical protein